MPRRQLIPEPAVFLREAIHAVPAVRWALAIGGVIAVPAIVFSWFKTKDVRIVALSVIVMLFLMMVMVIFAKAAGQPGSSFRIPGLIFTWFCLLLFIATSCCLFGSIFFGHPHLDWSFITHASSPSDDSETPAENEAKSLEADGDSDASNAIYYGYCTWHQDCGEYGSAFLPSRVLGGWARAKLHWKDARDKTTNSARFTRLKAKLDAEDSVSCRSDSDRRNATCVAKPKGVDDLAIGNKVMSATRPDLPNVPNVE